MMLISQNTLPTIERRLPLPSSSSTPTTEIRAIAALLRYAFPGKAFLHCAERAEEIARGDEEVRALISGLGSYLSLTDRD